MKGDFAVCAALTIRTMPAYVLSLARADARISKVSPALSEPLRASSPDLVSDRNWLPRQRGFIDRSLLTGYNAVDGNDFAGSYKNVVTD